MIRRCIIIDNVNRIVRIYEDTFTINKYSSKPFRVIGLIDVDMEFYYGIERVTLAFYRSSGTNNDKIKGLWYPIVGIKLHEGEFTEFSEYINYVLSNTTLDGIAVKGWLAKSLFFAKQDYNYQVPGFTNTKHYEALYYIGNTLRRLYNTKNYEVMRELNSMELNRILSSKQIYNENYHTQRENFERFIEDIFLEFVY